MSRMRRYISSVDPGMRPLILDLDAELDAAANRTGGNGLGTTGEQSVEPPPNADFNVAGVDGKFLILITNPQDINPQSAAIAAAQAIDGMNGAGAAIIHQVQSATTVNFDQASNLADYGVSPQLHYEIQDPNQTKFFRVRSSFDGTTWNNWQIFSSPLTCGPVGVMSGALRGEALVPNTQGNATNYAKVDSVDAGVSATVRVYSAAGGPGTNWLRQVSDTLVGPDGTANTSFPSGNLTGLAYNTNYTVFYDTVNKLFVAYTATQFAQSLPNGLAFAGTVTTVPSGGGTVATGTPVYSADLAPNKVITGVNITLGGGPYATAPNVDFNGDSTGHGAAGTAVLDGGGAVVGVVMTKQGVGYTGDGGVAFSGGSLAGETGGGGATGDDGGNRFLENPL